MTSAVPPRELITAENVGWAWVGMGLVLAIGPGDPSRDGWRAYIEANERRLRIGRGVSGVLVLPMGTAAPNAGQRAALREVLTRHAWSGPVAMVVSNPMGLTIARLFSLLDENMKPFAPGALDDALRHARLDGFGDDVRVVARELWRELSNGRVAFYE